MKKKILKFTLDALLLAGILYACQQDLDELTVNRPWSVDNARAWYEAHKPDCIQLKSGSNETKVKYIKPDWSRSIMSKNDREEVVETDIKTNGGFGFATQENYDAWKLTGNDNYIRTHTRLVIVRNKGAKTEEGFFMTIAGDKNYKEMHDFDMSENTYLKKGNDFSGLILFHHLDGSFSNGWKYTDGKLTHTAKIEMGEKIEFHLKSTASCQTENNYMWYISCTDYYYVVSYYNNGTLYSSNLNYSYSTCESIFVYLGSMTTCSSSSSGGGGYTGGTGDPVSLNATIKKLFVKGAPTLSDIDINSVNQAFNDLNNDCISKYITDQVTTRNISLGSISINEGMTGVASIDANGNLKFGGSSLITAEYWMNEWVHLAQMRLSNVKISDPSNEGMAEFEIKLLNDIKETINCGGNFSCTSHDFACYHSTKEQYRDEYNAWLISITSNGSRYPGTINGAEFYKWANVFGDISLEYPKGERYRYDNTSYRPTTLLLLAEFANNNCIN